MSSFKNFTIIVIINSCIMFLVAMMYLRSSDFSNHFKIYPRQSIKIKQSYAEKLLEVTRASLKLEMCEYNYSQSGIRALEDLVPEMGGKPVRTVLLSTWRAGSSFLGELIASVPGTFYSFEPLKTLGTYKQFRGPPSSVKAITLLKNIMQCDHTNPISKEYFRWMKKYIKTKNVDYHIKRFWNNTVCINPETASLCFEPHFLSMFYKLFPIQAIKLDRLRLSLAKDLLDDQLGVKLVLLIRDPRAIFNSRRKIKPFPKKMPNFAEPRALCEDMVVDHAAAHMLGQEYPGRLMVLRFEDLVLNLNETVVQLFKFLKLDLNPSVLQFLHTHTNVHSDPTFIKPYSTYRNTKAIPFQWTQEMDFIHVKEIQESCRKAMKLWGYEPVNSVEHLLNSTFNPLTPSYYKHNLTNSS